MIVCDKAILPAFRFLLRDLRAEGSTLVQTGSRSILSITYMRKNMNCPNCNCVSDAKLENSGLLRDTYRCSSCGHEFKKVNGVGVGAGIIAGGIAVVAIMVVPSLVIATVGAVGNSLLSNEPFKPGPMDG
jgi:predicted RNA-binding Zn-ribbon protein involved in translation (DUF1610 family)